MRGTEEEPTVSRRDWLLLLLAYEGAPDGLDPVRVQKSMFLLREEAGDDLAPDETYEFVPYNYGPMSKPIYADLDGLVAEGLAQKVPVKEQSWSLFRATANGLAKAERLVNGMSARDMPVARKLYEIKGIVAGKTFAELVEYGYERFPDYEARSIFRRQPTY